MESSQKSTIPDKPKNSLAQLLMKNKLEASTSKCKCPHDGVDVCLHAGKDYACSKCTENCIPF